MFNQLRTQQSIMSTVDHISFFKTHRKSTREVLPGHFSQGKVRTRIIILENQTYLMYCERHSICLLCRKSYDKITEAEKKLCDRRIPNGTRRTLTMKMKKGHCLMYEVQRLREKVTAKYER